MFYNVEKLEAGDDIFIDGRSGLLKYKVTGQEIIDPSDWEKVLPIEGKDMITLLTCHPKRPPRPKRLLINAERVVEKKPEPVEKVKEERQVSYLKYGIYGVTLIGWLAFIITFFKMIGYARQSKRRKVNR